MELKSNPKPRVGILLDSKKWTQYGQTLIAALSQRGMDAVQIRGDIDLEQQGPFAFIVHKIIFEFSEDTLLSSSLAKYIQAHDLNTSCSVKTIADIMDRDRTYSLIKQHVGAASVPSWSCFRSFRDIRTPPLRFPLICKSILACSTSMSHELVVYQTPDDLFNDPGLASMDNYFPILLQEYISHQRYYKLYIIDTFFYLLEIPSISPDSPVFRFNSASLPSSHTYVLDVHTLLQKNPHLFETIKQIVENVRTVFETKLLGIDLVVDNGIVYIVDVNYFPTYRGLADPMDRVADLVQHLLRS